MIDMRAAAIGMANLNKQMHNAKNARIVIKIKRLKNKLKLCIQTHNSNISLQCENGESIR